MAAPSRSAIFRQSVVNLDLPWNPAKLEQRIARAWRKNQMRSVAMINFVTETSIEHSILHRLGQKPALADGVLDGEGDLAALKMLSGRGAFIQRMQAMITEPKRVAPRVLSPQEAVTADLVARHGDRALLVEAREGGRGLQAVLDLDAFALAGEIERAAGGPEVEFIDKAAWTTIQRLAAVGQLRFSSATRTLHRSALLAPTIPAPAPDHGNAAAALAEADRRLRMAQLLFAGGIAEEAPPLLGRALQSVALALTLQQGVDVAALETEAGIRSLVEMAALPAEALPLLQATQAECAATDAVESLVAAMERILAGVTCIEPALKAGFGACMAVH